MYTQLRTAGIHHITAVSSSAAENLAFYRNVLGLRLVKKTVNFDDPYAYHFYYGDPAGSPGTILTFFPWENIPQGQTGAGMVTAVSFTVPTGSLGYWSERLTARGIKIQKDERFGDSLIRFSDPHGLPLEVIGAAKAPLSIAVAQPIVPYRYAIVGFHSATSVLRSMADTHDLLVDAMGMALQAKEGHRHRYRIHGDDHPGIFYDVVQDNNARPGRPGGGTIHHIAFRTKDAEEQHLWQQSLREQGYAVTPVRDRNYFRSIYFTTPGGVLFEIATDPPGFTVDEPKERLGRSLKLPAQYESRRAEIESHLPPLVTSDFQHLFIHPVNPADDGHTMVALHGTGGNEHDLIDLVGRIAGDSAILCPRGKVLENGMPRFFRRLAEGVLDEDDVIRRAHELADFVITAAPPYGRSLESLVALGYSNGANIAAAVLLLRPEVFSRAVLLRPMLPLQNPSLPNLEGKEILILKGRHDATIPAESTDRLIHLLKRSGARVTISETEAGHAITGADLETASQWLKETAPGKEQFDSAAEAEPIM